MPQKRYHRSWPALKWYKQRKTEMAEKSQKIKSCTPTQTTLLCTSRRSARKRSKKSPAKAPPASASRKRWNWFRVETAIAYRKRRDKKLPLCFPVAPSVYKSASTCPSIETSPVSTESFWIWSPSPRTQREPVSVKSVILSSSKLSTSAIPERVSFFRLSKMRLCTGSTCVLFEKRFSSNICLLPFLWFCIVYGPAGKNRTKERKKRLIFGINVREKNFLKNFLTNIKFCSILISAFERDVMWRCSSVG